jgi:hypothetical protein
MVIAAAVGLMVLVFVVLALSGGDDPGTATTPATSGATTTPARAAAITLDERLDRLDALIDRAGG